MVSYLYIVPIVIRGKGTLERSPQRFVTARTQCNQIMGWLKFVIPSQVKSKKVNACPIQSAFKTKFKRPRNARLFEVQCGKTRHGKTKPKINSRYAVGCSFPFYISGRSVNLSVVVKVVKKKEWP